MRTIITAALLAAAMLCASVLAQENSSEDWFNRGQKLQRKDSY